MKIYDIINRLVMIRLMIEKGGTAMKKWIFTGLFLVVSLTLMGSSQADIGAIQLKNYPYSSDLKQAVDLTSEDLLGEIVLLPTESFDEIEAAAIISRLDQLPSTLLQKIDNQNIKIKLFSGRLTENPSVRHLTGMIPRGYTSSTTWDQVPGIGGGKTVLVKIGYSDQGMDHGSVNLELHELAHSIDRYIFEEIRSNSQFIRIWQEEQPQLFPNDSYFSTFSEEYFAESFALYFLNVETRSYLYENAPKTFSFIRQMAHNH